MPSYIQSKSDTNIQSNVRTKLKFVKDIKLAAMKNFTSNFAEDLGSRTNNGDVEVARCGIFVGKNFIIASFDWYR